MLLAPNIRTSAIYYFITALFILLACFDTYFALPLNVNTTFHFKIRHINFIVLLCIPVIRGSIICDQQLTLNFGNWVEFFCVPTWFHMRISKSCLSVCLSICLSVPREKKSPLLRQYQSYSSNWCIHNLHEYYSMKTLKFDFFFSKKDEIEFWKVPKCWNHPSFVNISPTVVIGTWLERFSRVIQHGNPKKYIYFFNAYLSVSAVMFCKQFLAYAVHIDRFVFLCNP